MKTITGDLIRLAKAGEFDVIVHGANCLCTMGAGIARQIAKEFPRAFEVDRTTESGNRKKLGTCTTADCGSIIVVNAYTQFGYGGGIANIDYDAVRSCMRCVADAYPDKRIGLPKIGAGLAGGDWDLIYAIIEDELAGMDVTIVEWEGSNNV